MTLYFTGIEGLALTWFIDKLDRLLAGMCIAALALMAALIAPFEAQYMAGSGADLGRAEVRLADAQSGLRTQTMADQVRTEIVASAQKNLANAQAAHDALAKTTPLLHPIAIWRWVDADIRSATWASFIPALPRSVWSIVFTILGALIGLSLYELIKGPLVTVLSAPRRRFKKHGLI